MRLDRRESRITKPFRMPISLSCQLATRRLLTLREAVVLNDNLLATSYERGSLRAPGVCLRACIPWTRLPRIRKTHLATVKRTPARFYLAAHLGDMLAQPLLDLSKIRFRIWNRQRNR